MELVQIHVTFCENSVFQEFKRISYYYSVYHMLFECPIKTALFKKGGYDFTSCNSVTDILHNTDVIIPFAKLIVRSLVRKL